MQQSHDKQSYFSLSRESCISEDICVVSSLGAMLVAASCGSETLTLKWFSIAGQGVAAFARAIAATDLQYLDISHSRLVSWAGIALFTCTILTVGAQS